MTLCRCVAVSLCRRIVVEGARRLRSACPVSRKSRRSGRRCCFRHASVVDVSTRVARCLCCEDNDRQSHSRTAVLELTRTVEATDDRAQWKRTPPVPRTSWLRCYLLGASPCCGTYHPGPLFFSTRPTTNRASQSVHCIALLALLETHNNSATR